MGCIDKVNSANDLVDATKKVKEMLTKFKESKNYVNCEDLFKYKEQYKSIDEKSINEILIKPIIFTSPPSSIMGDSNFRIDDVWIDNTTNKLINKYFIKYINNNKDKIWNEMYKYMKDDIKKNKESILSEIDKLKNNILNM